MFLGVNNQPKDRIALVDDSGTEVTYGELINLSKLFFYSINKRTLVFILADNSIEAFSAYYSCLDNRVVPLLLSHTIDMALLKVLIEKYHPEYLFVKKSGLVDLGFPIVREFEQYVLVATDLPVPPLNEDLAMLLPTSGSTGSPKLVRHSTENLEFSARSVSLFFLIDPDDVAITFLPIYYTMGLSVVNSHLKAGAKVVLTNFSLTDSRFWQTMRHRRVSNFTGVPYSYEILDKLRFSKMDLPALKVISQGGGKLKDALFEKFSDYAAEKGIKFIPTYGQTEGSARMAFLSPENVFEKKGSIGKAIPGGYLGVIDENGEELPENCSEVEGEMIYKGPNVTLGYAETAGDLMKGNENKGFLVTGDLVRRDSEGYFYIIGRKKRFLKIFGLRISLDELENMIKSNFDLDCVCSGSDDKLLVAINNSEVTDEVKNFISLKTGLFHGVIDVLYMREFKRNEAGKIMFTDIS